MKRLASRQRPLLLAALTMAAACSTAPPHGDEAAMAPRAPFQAACEMLDRSVGACTLTTVPAGHRLVIEMVTGRQGRFRGAETIAGPALQTTVNGVAQRHWLTREFIGANALGLDVYLVTHRLRLYADPATPVIVEIPDGIGAFTISGYLVKLP